MLSTGREDVLAAPWTRPLQVLAGELPAQLRGHAFISGSIASPGRPAFSGEGVLYRIDFGAGEVALTRALLRPPCFYADQALEDADDVALLRFRDLGLTRLSPLLGVRTVLGTSPVALRDRMIVTTDAGRPWEFDPRTLELVTPIGDIDEWRGTIPAPWVFPLQLTSAHPVADPRTGELFTANYGTPGPAPHFCHLVRFGGPGDLEHFQPVDDSGAPVVIHQCVHQIGLTRNHVILQDSAFVVEIRQLVADAVALVAPDLPGKELLAGSLHAHRPTTVLYLIPRAAMPPGSGGSVDAPTPVPSIRVELDGESVHFFAQYDDDRELTVIVPHTPTLDVSEWIREGERMVDGSRADDLADLPVPCALTEGTIAVHTLDPRTGESLEYRTISNQQTWGLGLGAQSPADPTLPIETLFFNTSGFFPELLPQRLVKAYAHRVDTSLLPIESGRPPRLLAFDVATATLTDYACPNGWCILSPVFIPRHDRPHGREGYVLCLAHAAAGVPRTPGSSGEEVWIFDATDIARGPVCRLGHPELDFAFTVHGAWVPALRPSPRDYHVSTAEDVDLEYLLHAAFGRVSFWDAFATAVSTAMQRDVVERLLAEHVIPRFPDP